MTIHDDHPFATPEGDRDAVRRLRGRLAGGVTLWTSGSGRARSGLTISSLLVVGGEPARVIALIDPLADLLDALRDTSTAAVSILADHHRGLAGKFAGTEPAPGGAFTFGRFEETRWGPVLIDSPAHAGVRLESEREVGWSVEVVCAIEDVAIGEPADPLIHHRGEWV